ncbi:anthranilate synthase component I [Brevundimonas sp.]|uniref:anthranilate synthase component I n=1 Tax=Brevundimonas sp. TaxID=1871086 RepID=UPI0025FAE352|nr:anthranilate synthase component I [Brevundimonas sp.]
MTADAFERLYAAGRPQVVSRRLIDDLETPVSAYLKVGRGRPFAFLFESVEGGAWRGRYSILAVEPDLVWRCREDRAEVARGAEAVKAGAYARESLPALESLRALVAECRIDLPDDLPPMAAGLFGVFGYDMVRLVEPVGPAKADPLDLPDAVWARPSVVAVFDGVAQEIILCTPVWPGEATADEARAAANARLDAFEAQLKSPLPAGRAPQPTVAPELVSDVDAAAYARVVERAKAYIGAGDIFQVVAGHRFEGPAPSDSFAFYRSLRRTNPSPFLFHLDFGGFALAGSSPEILVRLRDGEVTIRPLAGTRPRGATPAEDMRLEAELLADPKERAEHLMLLDLGRNDVGRVALPGSVEVTKSFYVERYSHVMHIVSNVVGKARTDLDPVDVLTAALPAGTLSGAPKVRAMQIIDELETTKRGVGYGGAAGYIGAGGEIDACIVLRTALFKDGRMYVQAGAGLVADSDPASEYAETQHKARALMRAAEEAWRFG